MCEQQFFKYTGGRIFNSVNSLFLRVQYGLPFVRGIKFVLLTRNEVLEEENNIQFANSGASVKIYRNRSSNISVNTHNFSSLYLKGYYMFPSISFTWSLVSFLPAKESILVYTKCISQVSKWWQDFRWLSSLVKEFGAM